MGLRITEPNLNRTISQKNPNLYTTIPVLFHLNRELLLIFALTLSPNSITMKRILLTGVTGFLGSHTTIQLLNKGYTVTGTLRDPSRADAMRKVIAAHTEHTDRLDFAALDLMDAQEKWEEQMQRADAVIHIASPFPTRLPKREEELIVPAREGTLRILRAAKEQGVPKVVLTSSTGAAVYGVSRHKQFTEKDWTDEGNYKDTTPYFRSKTIAEKAAWNYVQQTAGAPALVSILPGAILGPVLEQDFGTSANIVKKLMDGSIPALPSIKLAMVDVRSVAALHIAALESEAANGQRFMAANGLLGFKDVAVVLQEHFPDRKLPSKMLPDWLVRVFSLIDQETKPILLELGASRSVDARKAQEVLDWKPISLKQSITDCADSLLRLNLVK